MTTGATNEHNQPGLAAPSASLELAGREMLNGWRDLISAGGAQVIAQRQHREKDAE